MGHYLGACDWRNSPDEWSRRERAIAIVRSLISAMLFGAALLVPMTALPVALERIALGAYASAALVALAVLNGTNRRRREMRLPLHSLDIFAGVSLLHYG